MTYDQRPATFVKLADHFFTTFPQLEGIGFSHRWGGAIDASSRFCAFFGTAHHGRVAYALGYTGLGVGASRFGARVMLDLLSGERTELTELQLVRSKPVPFPPEPFAYLGVQATRWSLAQADQKSGRRNLWLRALDAAGMGYDSLCLGRWEPGNAAGRRGEFHPEDGLASILRRYRPDRGVRGVDGAQAGTHGPRIGGATHVSRLIVAGQVGKTERDARAGARADVPEVQDVDRLVPGHRRECHGQPRVDLAGDQLVPGGRRERDLGIVQQRGSGSLSGCPDRR